MDAKARISKLVLQVPPHSGAIMPSIKMPRSFWGWLGAVAAGISCAGTAILFALLLYYVGRHTFLYVTRSPEKALQRASAAFRGVCKVRHVSSADFTGPRLDYSDPEKAYFIFVWTKRGDSRQTMDVLVSYSVFGGIQIHESRMLPQSNDWPDWREE